MPMCRLSFRDLTCFAAISIASILIALPSGFAQDQADVLPQIIDQLVTAYNNQDANSYRQHFGEKLKGEFSLEQIQKILSDDMNGKGPIVSHSAKLTPDGKRALVFLTMENSKFNVHLRINEQSKLERLVWLPHKADPSVSMFSAHEQHLIIEKYQPFADKFIQAIRDIDAEAGMSLMAKDEDDDWTIEDHRSFLTRMNNRGIKSVGQLEVLAKNEVLIPLFFESIDVGIYLGFDKADKITSLKMTNYAPVENQGLSYTTLGADTLRTSDLNSYDQLHDAFASDSGKVRFVVLLAPT